MTAIERLKNFRMQDTEVLAVGYVSEGHFTGADGLLHEELPAFYRVCLKMTPGEGSLIFTEVWLPEDWNGIYLGIGSGGMAGSIDYWSLARRLRENYVVSNTDMGTSRGRDCGIGNPDVWKDFGWRATHLMTVAASRPLPRPSVFRRTMTASWPACPQTTGSICTPIFYGTI